MFGTVLINLQKNQINILQMQNQASESYKSDMVRHLLTKLTITQKIRWSLDVGLSCEKPSG